MALTFEWDRRKATANDDKHAVSFEEATTVFGDPLSITVADPDHSADEERFIIIGKTPRQRLLVVVHTAKGERIRLISARIASRTERKNYEEADF